MMECLAAAVRCRAGAKRTCRTMQRETSSNDRRAHALGIATALMCALAGGAVWCLLSLYARRDLAAFAFVVALLIAWALRAHGFGGRWLGALLAAVCVAVGSLYAFCLQAVAQVASLLGLSMRATLWRMDPAMAFDIARANLSGENALIVAGAIVLAIALMLRGYHARPR
jgi:hypothetical protein